MVLFLICLPKGVISYAPGLEEDTVMDAALEAGADDIVVYDDGAIDVFTAWESLGAVKMRWMLPVWWLKVQKCH